METVPPVRIELLGPLRLILEGEPVEVRGPKRRAILALLALAEGRTVPVDLLVDELWPAEGPDSARQAVQTHVSRLRALLGPAAARLQTGQDSYRLDLGADELDLTQARTLLAAARADPPAVDPLRAAHALWRGPVLADLTDVPRIGTAVEGCARLQREVSDALVAAAVAVGQAADVLGLAAESVAADPLREPAVLALMRALAAGGQPAEALRVGREYRRRLVDEAGLDPSKALDELARDIAGGVAGGVSGGVSGPVPVRVGMVPRPVNRLVGRAADVAALHRLLAAERLVTVVGPGGVGKSRVALAVADRTETVAVLLLAPITEPAALPHALATALNLTVARGDVLSACIAVLADRAGLLVIDNCEHLLGAARDIVGSLLSGCPRLSVLATSREPLGLAEEYGYRLAPLALSSGHQPLADVPSVAVFLDRAARVRPGPAATPEDLATVADIVRRLDGIPLAIELAAGRLSTFTLADLRTRLDRALDLLGGGRPSGNDRHRTLRDTIDWSYRLLSADEQRLFRHLSVFADGVDLDTAERIALELGLGSDPGTALARLVDASMINAVFEGGARYRMLETLRAFGLDRLVADGEQDAAARRIVRWAVELAAWIDATVITEREPEADIALRRELPNLRTAWRVAREHGCLDEAAAIVQSLFGAVFNRDLVELRGWAVELAGDPGLDGHPRATAVLGTAAYAAYLSGDQPGAERLGRAGLTTGADRDGSSYCLHALAVAALARGAWDEVVELCLTGAAGGDERHGFLGVAALAKAYAGEHDEARRLNDSWLAGVRSPAMRAWNAYYAGEIENAAGRGELAEQLYLRAISLARSPGATFVTGVAVVGLQSVRAAGGRAQEALAGYREAIDYFARTGNWTHQWTTLRNLADLLRRLGDREPATVIDAAADQAPDAPPVDRPATAVPAGSVPGRDAVLALARAAITRNLAAPDGRPSSPPELARREVGGPDRQ